MKLTPKLACEFLIDGLNAALKSFSTDVKIDDLVLTKKRSFFQRLFNRNSDTLGEAQRLWDSNFSVDMFTTKQIKNTVEELEEGGYSNEAAEIMAALNINKKVRPLWDRAYSSWNSSNLVEMKIKLKRFIKSTKDRMGKSVLQLEILKEKFKE